MTENVAPFDFARMFLGSEPPLFLLEIAFRTIFIYVYTLVLIRWIGSRSIAQLSLVEFLLVIALGSAVGDAMFYPDVPLFHCMVVITVVVLLDKALSFTVARSPRLEDVIEGKSIQIVLDGIIDCAKMRSANFGHDELFEQLRLNKVEHLGQVRSAYLETNGMISVFNADESSAKSGLSIEPPWDVRPPVKLKAGDAARAEVACPDCGTVIQANVHLPKCPNCNSVIWHQARRS